MESLRKRRSVGDKQFLCLNVRPWQPSFDTSYHPRLQLQFVANKLHCDEWRVM